MVVGVAGVGYADGVAKGRSLAGSGGCGGGVGVCGGGGGVAGGGGGVCAPH